MTDSHPSMLEMLPHLKTNTLTIDPSNISALAQWLVMSIDCRCVVKYHERNPMDEATLRLFKSAAEFGQEQVSRNVNAVKKQKIWIKCCTRLLSSCSSKHKKFLAYNQPALHTSIRKVLEFLGISDMR